MLCLLFLTPVWSVVSSCSPWYGFLGRRVCARVEVLCHDVDVYAMDGDVLRESDGSVFKEGQVGLVVVPRWKSSFCSGSKIQKGRLSLPSRCSPTSLLMLAWRSSVQTDMSGVDVVSHSVE